MSAAGNFRAKAVELLARAETENNQYGPSLKIWRRPFSAFPSRQKATPRLLPRPNLLPQNPGDRRSIYGHDQAARGSYKEHSEISSGSVSRRGRRDSAAAGRR